MVSRVARHVLETLGGIAVVAAVPASGFSQSESAEWQRIAEDISATEAESGRQSPELIDLLNDLALLYEAEGEHAQATAVLEQARQLVRVNYGLHTLEQVPLLEQALENQQALGNLAMVQTIEEQLLTLAGRHPTDLRSAAIHRDVGARRLDLLRRFLAGEYPAEIYPDAGLWSFSKSGMIWRLVWEVQAHYGNAAAVFLRSGLHSNDELHSLEEELVRTAGMLRQRNQRSVGVGDEWNTYSLARTSYRRLIGYEEAVSATAPADGLAWKNRLETYLELADWDLLYSRNWAALDEYAQVLALLKTTRTEPLIAELFAPPMPVVLPAFLPNPLRTETSAGYIDATFEITRLGESRRIEIVDKTPNVSDRAVRSLVRLIKHSRFRPRVADGELARASPVAVRYYVSE